MSEKSNLESLKLLIPVVYWIYVLLTAVFAGKMFVKRWAIIEQEGTVSSGEV